MGAALAAGNPVIVTIVAPVPDGVAPGVTDTLPHMGVPLTKIVGDVPAPVPAV